MITCSRPLSIGTFSMSVLLMVASDVSGQMTPCGGPTLDPAPSITLTWPTGAGNGYQMQLDTTPFFSDPIYSSSFGSSSLSTNVALQYGKHYYWKIAPTFNGSWGAFSSPPCEFYTNATISAPTTAPNIGLPSEGQTNISGSTQLYWGAVGGSDSYDYQYSTSPTFSGASTTNTTGHSVFLSPLAVATTYYCRVRAKNIAGTGPWSATRTFYTQTVVTAMTLKVFLQGPLVIGTPSLMSDGLRAASLIPTNEPYSALGYTVRNNYNVALTPSLLSTAGNNAIVDWVFMEFMNGTNNSVVSSYAMLLQRDGDVVFPDGSAINMAFPMSSIKVAVRHRNHLAAMTNTPVTPNGTALTVNFTSTGTATYGTNAQYTSGAVAALWAGDCNGDGIVGYTGANNDRDKVLVAIGGVVPTASVNGYLREDVNLSGVVLYTGSGNDRDIILQTIGGVVPTNTRAQQMP